VRFEAFDQGLAFFAAQMDVARSFHLRSVLDSSPPHGLLKFELRVSIGKTAQK